jgi:hypothetical protein
MSIRQDRLSIRLQPPRRRHAKADRGDFGDVFRGSDLMISPSSGQNNHIHARQYEQTHPDRGVPRQPDAWAGAVTSAP